MPLVQELLWRRQWNHTRQGRKYSEKGRHIHKGNGPREVNNDAEIIVWVVGTGIIDDMIDGYFLDAILRELA